MSALAEKATEYLALRQGLGHGLERTAMLLPRFIAHLEATGSEMITIEAALSWATEPTAGPTVSVAAHRMMIVRGFARYMRAIDPRTEVPPVGLVHYRQRWRPPFVYSEHDVEAMMSSAAVAIATPWKADTLATMIGLLAATGMRVGEAISLERDDVDLVEGVITIRHAKFGKSRALPVTRSTTEALAAYARRREAQFRHVISPMFFLGATGNRVNYSSLQRAFRRTVETSGVGAGSNVVPRAHDLRHSFAVRVLADWHRSGRVDDAPMAWLSTYMGHCEPRSTYWYLSAAPELLGAALEHLELAEEVAP
jgi:integrase/recombinase XerD